MYILHSLTAADPLVSDIVVADPLFFVPLYPQNGSPLGHLVGLCYQVHGERDHYYNLVTSNCTSVNARWTAATDTLNIITRVVVRVISMNSTCHSILIDLEECAVTIDGVGPNTDNGVILHMGDVVVRRGDDWVTVKVPNCMEPGLFLRVDCERRNIFNSETDAYEMIPMLKLNITRRRSARSGTAHGLIGNIQSSYCSCHLNETLIATKWLNKEPPSAR